MRAFRSLNLHCLFGMEGCDREKVSNMVVQYAGHFPGVCVYPTALLWDYISKKSENPSDEAIDNRIIVDVREDAEMKVSVIPFSISRREFESDVMPSLDKNTLIIPYCTIGNLSSHGKCDLLILM